MTARTAAKVKVRKVVDVEQIVYFNPSVFLDKPREITVTVPQSKGNAPDTIELHLQEGNWAHTELYIQGHVECGLAGGVNEIGRIVDGPLTCNQFDRLIEALQRARAEAGKLGILTPRKTPTRRTS